MPRVWISAVEFTDDLTKIMPMLFQLVPPTTAQTTQRRRMAVVILFCALIGSVDFIDGGLVAAETAPAAQPTGVRDFVEYWSASRLLLNGDNPYAPDELLQLQRSVGWDSGAALIMWNPPWTLPFTLPFGLLSFNLGQFAWLCSQLLLVLICTQALAHLYGGRSTSCRIEWCVALSFVPTVFVLIIGQISPLVLAGITGFLVLERRGKWLAAGAMLAVVAIKPHLLYLFWLALFLWICRYRRWQVLFGAVMAFLIVALLPVYFDRHIYRQYFDLYNLPGIVKPFDWPAPTLRNIFPLLFDHSDRWLESLPTLAGLAWLGYYWRKHQAQWQWRETLPVVLLVSVTTSFFAWTYDQVVLLPALIEVTAWLRQTKLPWYRSWAALGYIAINGLHIAMRFWFAEEFVYLWLAPALTLCYVVYRYERRILDVAKLYT